MSPVQHLPSRPAGRLARRGLMAAALAVCVAACGSGRDVAPISPQDLADQVGEAVEAELGVPAIVVCEEELPAEVGAEAECRLNTDDDPDALYPVTATVTEVDADTGEVAFEIEIADAPQEAEDGDEDPEGQETGSGDEDEDDADEESG